MKAGEFWDEACHVTDALGGGRALRIVIAYNGSADGKRALRVMAHIRRKSGEEVEVQPAVWSFAALADEDWAEAAAGDAARADILVIATSCTNPLPAAVGHWAESAIRRKEGTSAAVVALLGPEESPDGRDSSRLQAIQTAACVAGLDFFAPSPSHEHSA